MSVDSNVRAKVVNAVNKLQTGLLERETEVSILHRQHVVSVETYTDAHVYVVLDMVVAVCALVLCVLGRWHLLAQQPKSLVAHSSKLLLEPGQAPYPLHTLHTSRWRRPNGWSFCSKSYLLLCSGSVRCWPAW